MSALRASGSGAMPDHKREHYVPVSYLKEFVRLASRRTARHSSTRTDPGSCFQTSWSAVRRTRLSIQFGGGTTTRLVTQGPISHCGMMTFIVTGRGSTSATCESEQEHWPAPWFLALARRTSIV